MHLFKCRGCAAYEKELERLHHQLQRATDLLAEKTAPGTSQRVPHAMPLPPPVRLDPAGDRYIPQLTREENVFPGYEPEVTREMVKLVEPEES